MNVSSTAKIRMEMRAHPRRRKIAMAVQIPQPLKRANIEAIAIPIAAMGNGGAAGPVGGGASVMLTSIKPPSTRVARLPAMASPPLARIPIPFLAMIADQCTGLCARGPGGLLGRRWRDRRRGGVDSGRYFGIELRCATVADCK